MEEAKEHSYLILDREGWATGTVWGYSVKPHREGSTEVWVCGKDGFCICSAWYGVRLVESLPETAKPTVSEEQ